MIKAENIKILIVGLTSILSLINFTKSDFRKEIINNLVEAKF
ncbi:hypothetical protein [Flavobacterium sp.]